MTINQQVQPTFSGNTLLQSAAAPARGEFVILNGERFYKIQHYNSIEPFFISLVSSSNHWLFIASTGGISAGRVSAEQALFPYYTADKITENSESTGHKAIFLVSRPDRDGRCLWEPFSDRQSGEYCIERNLYKNETGTTLIFEEINSDLDLIYRYAWHTSDRYGFIKTSWLVNIDAASYEVELVDGLQNLLPANVTSQTQNTFSVLLDAYKRCELEPETGLGIITLSSCLTDLAEPSESLLATTVAQVGLEHADYLLSSLQLDHFRRGERITPEREVLGRRAAYLVHTTLHLAPREQKSWHLMADVNLDHAAVTGLLNTLRGDSKILYQAIENDIIANQANLVKLITSADGQQLTQASLCTAHHFANVLFNVLRGGIFAEQYWVQAHDLKDFITVHRPALLSEQADFFESLPARLHIADLQTRAAAFCSVELERLCGAYLPLTFSRRHGDPSRPWNRFTINLKKPDGTLRLDYEGNWRDIFQNWEALAWSYPGFVENMLSVFLNATTVDGYNPYRITRDGADWERPEPGNPWANIGYWSDHQIIYLQKLMEISTSVHPGKLAQLLSRPVFSYANVPYHIKPYADLLADPYNTINFDWELQRTIDERVRKLGTAGKLVLGPDGEVFHASLAEKLLTLLLAKLSNFVPEGGIWMNTQRPEWNDANNALVGKGLSVVTLCYLRRYLVFCRELFANSGLHTVPVGQEVVGAYLHMAEILAHFHPVLAGSFDDEQRRDMMDALGQVGSATRWEFYTRGLSGTLVDVSTRQIGEFINLSLEFVEHALRANKRSDHLYHSYNILKIKGRRAEISHLYEMLEGQVAILSSGLLSGDEALALLRSLRNGPLYRADQNSYILYPDRRLPGFLEKNTIPSEQAHSLALLQALATGQDNSLVVQDHAGDYHFSGHIRNVKDVNRALVALQAQPQFAELAAAEAEKIRTLFEEMFRHDEFTGRSGTFFAYEGLGSIYWHMVSKLLLAVQENALQARDEPAGSSLAAAYMDIRQGLGFHKSPDIYGAFPTDPYSHTPKGQGAKQPGMTGQVKEEILTRKAELGLFVKNGRLVFDTCLLDPQELLTTPAVFSWLDVAGQTQTLALEPGSLAYTFCQVPIVLYAGDQARIETHRADGAVQAVPGQVLDAATSQHIFRRDGQVHHLVVYFSHKT